MPKTFPLYSLHLLFPFSVFLSHSLSPLCACAQASLVVSCDDNSGSRKDYHSQPLVNFKVKRAQHLWLCVFKRKANDELISSALCLLLLPPSEDLLHAPNGITVFLRKKYLVLLCFIQAILLLKFLAFKCIHIC